MISQNVGRISVFLFLKSVRNFSSHLWAQWRCGTFRISQPRISAFCCFVLSLLCSTYRCYAHLPQTTGGLSCGFQFRFWNQTHKTRYTVSAACWHASVWQRDPLLSSAFHVSVSPFSSQMHVPDSFARSKCIMMWYENSTRQPLYSLLTQAGFSCWVWLQRPRIRPDQILELCECISPLNISWNRSKPVRAYLIPPLSSPTFIPVSPSCYSLC